MFIEIETHSGEWRQGTISVTSRGEIVSGTWEDGVRMTDEDFQLVYDLYCDEIHTYHARKRGWLTY